MSSGGKKGGYVSAQSMSEARERLARRENSDTGVSEEDLRASSEAARKHLRDSGTPVFERTGEVKQGTSPAHVRRALAETDYSRMNLPREHREAHSRLIQNDEVRVLVANYGTRIVEMMKSATGLFLTGDPGAGKSSIASILVKEAARRGFSAYFASHEELSDLRFENRPFGDGVSVMGRIRAVDLLVLDNFDSKFLEDGRFGPDELEKLVRRRNANLLATIITTRVGKTMAAKHKRGESKGQLMFPGLMDTLLARAAVIRIYGDDMRDRSKSEAHARVFGSGGD